MGDVTLQELLDEFDDAEDLENAFKEYLAIEKQVEKALVEGIDGDADVRMVQSILLTKLVGVAMSMGMPKRKFMDIVSNTWRLVEWHNEQDDDGVVH
jgi:hypothetical protein